jgi:surface polysaccharide O-acyltransferase-like enzyme
MAYPLFELGRVGAGLDDEIFVNIVTTITRFCEPLFELVHGVLLQWVRPVLHNAQAVSVEDK